MNRGGDRGKRRFFPEIRIQLIHNHLLIPSWLSKHTRRVACDLVQSFDVILLPSFETKEMSAKEDRRIRTKTVRSMPGLAHHRFRQRLEWMCRKFGKRLVTCNEACTSRTRSWDGFVNEHLGGTKTVSDGSIVVDRDMNGARGIMLRALYGNLGRFRAAGDDVALVAE